MQKFYGFFYSLENKISKYSIEEGVLPDFAERRKAKLLSNDIATIGHQVSMNLLPPIPEIRNLDYAIGCLYVVEGSTLGGGFIFKLLNENLQLTVFKGASYFYGYGKETGNKWKVFIENL